MNPERWKQVDELFNAALEREPSQRATFLEQACDGDATLRQEVESMLASDDQARSFIEKPAMEGASDSLKDQNTPPMIGRTIGPYKITGSLGAGGMGEVYLAQDTRLTRMVAIKLLPAQFTHDEDRLRRFELEARAVSALNHPNILTIFDIGQVDTLHFIVTEFIEGETLRQRMANGRLSLHEVLDVGIQAASALSAAHQAGIVHRDIKPENLMLRHDGYVKVLDFGLAKLTECRALRTDSESPTIPAIKTEAGMLMGTAPYMSPEQVQGIPLDERSDIFSLGTVLYEMLAGRNPFAAENPAATITAILSLEPPPLLPHFSEAPKELQRIVQKSLEKDPNRRYQSVSELANDLANVSLEAEGTEKKDSHPEQTPVDGKGVSADRRVAGGGRFRSYRVLVSTGLVAVLIIAASVYALLFRRSPPTSVPTEIKSLAVLPLENLSGDSAQEYFSDGMTEALITDLGKISALKVISRTSAMQYKGVKKSLREIAAELHVDAVVEGSVVRSRDRVRVTANLIQADTDQHLWGDTYERDLRDVLTLQDDVAQAIAQEIRVKLTPQEHALLTRSRPINPEAHEAYLKGRYYFEKRSKEALSKSIEYFEQAIARDPGYAPAYAGLADAYSILGFGLAAGLPSKEAGPKAKAAAMKAVELDDTLGEAHTSLAYIKEKYDWDFGGAEKEFQRAIQLNPGYAAAHLWYGNHLSTMGQMEEALNQVKRAQQLDPISPSINSVLGMLLIRVGRQDEGLEQCRKAVELEPRQINSRARLAFAYALTRHYEQAVVEFKKAEEISPETENIRGGLGYVYALSGKRADAEKIMQELKQNPGQPWAAGDIALIDMVLGRKDEAFHWLERAYEMRDPSVISPQLSAALDPLRSDPRFRDLQSRFNFPQ